MRQAIHDMKADRQLLQAVLKLQYLAEDVCAIFNVHVREFIEHIWKGLQNEDVMVREHSVAALRVPPPSLHPAHFPLPTCPRPTPGKRWTCTDACEKICVFPPCRDEETAAMCQMPSQWVLVGPDSMSHRRWWKYERALTMDTY